MAAGRSLNDNLYYLLEYNYIIIYLKQKHMHLCDYMYTLVVNGSTKCV